MDDADPSLFNLSAEQSLLDLAQRSYARSAEATWHRASVANQESRREVLLQTALAFAELSAVQVRQSSLRREQDAAERLLQMQSLRTGAGVDEPVALVRAKLAAAEALMRTSALQATANRLRRSLAAATGLPEADVNPVLDSIPVFDDMSLERVLDERVVEDARIKMADYQAQSAELRAEGEHRSRWPTMGFGVQYELFSRFNNYSSFYRKFEKNNATIGVTLHLPLLDLPQADRVREADSEAVLERRKVANVANEVLEENRALKDSLEEAALARDVAQLKYMLANSESTAAEVGEHLGKVSPPVETLALLGKSATFDALLESISSQQSAVLRVFGRTGKLETWVLSEREPSTNVTDSIPDSDRAHKAKPDLREGGQIKSVLVVPSLSSLVVGQSRQLSVVLIYSNGNAQIISSGAVWKCSSNWSAVISRRGLLTALAPGEVTVSVETVGQSQSLTVLIRPDENK